MSLFGVLVIIIVGTNVLANDPFLLRKQMCNQTDMKALFLTPLIEKGYIKFAQNSAVVNLPQYNIKSYSGYLTVNKELDSNLFFWFFPAEDYKNKPLLLWLQGGPGASSLYGLFLENGPLKVQNGKLFKKKYAWSSSHSMLYIDNPVGSGFSFTKGPYIKSAEDAGKDLYIALLQFFKLFPEFTKNEFFIAGESYSGKFVPNVGYSILKNNPTAEMKINLKGLLIGDGYVNPITQFHFSKFLYPIGLLDPNQKRVYERIEARGTNQIKKGEYLKAYFTFNSLMSELFQGFTGFSGTYNLLELKQPSPSSQPFVPFVQTCEMRHALHVGSNSFDVINNQVTTNLHKDATKSVVPMISELLSHYPMLIYNGQLDMLVSAVLTEEYLHKMEFSGAEDFRKSKRKIWHVGGKVAGYVNQGGNLTFAIVRNAGHEVPADQPRNAYELITTFTHHRRYN